MKENRLTPAESFSLGSGVRGALIARTGSLIASGGNAVCCCAAGSLGCGCRVGCVWGFCPAASGNMASSPGVDGGNCLKILPPFYFNFLLKKKDLGGLCGRSLSPGANPPQKFFQTFCVYLQTRDFQQEQSTP